MRRRSEWLAYVLALSFLYCAMALAQETPGVAAPTTAGPVIIPTADIPARAEMDARLAQEAIQRSQTQTAIAALEPQLNELAQSVREQRQLFNREQLNLLPVIRLESLARQWRFFERQIEAWRGAHTEASSQHVDDAANLGRRKADWKATLAAAEVEGMPAALLERIRTLELQLTQAERTVYEPLDKLLRLGDRANIVAADIDAGRKLVNAAIDYNDKRLTQIDAPPLWKLGTQPAVDNVEVVKTGLQVESRFLQNYSKANRPAHRAYGIFELTLLPLLIWLSFILRRSVADDAATQASLRVLQRPFSSWLLIVMMGVLLVEPDAPILLHQIVLLITLIPVLRLLPLRVFQVLGAWPYITSALYLLNLLSFVFLSHSFYYRLYLLSLSLIAMGLILWRLLKTRRRSAIQDDPAADRGLAVKAARNAGRLALAVLSASVVANIVGNVSLADMLTDALLMSAYVGMVVYAGAHALTAVIRLLLVRSALGRLHIISQHRASIMRVVARLLHLAALAGWLIITLNQFRIFRPIYESIRAVLTHTISFGAITLTLGGALLFVFSVLLAFWVSKSVRFILRDEVLPNMSLPRGVANSVSSLTYYLLIIVGLFVAMAAAGFEVGQLAFVIGALGVGIGLGLQGVVNNFVSGLILMFERPIQPGDVVEITGTVGRVSGIGMRATTITTFDGADVVVPNGTLLSEKLINWTLSNMNRRFEIPFGVAYGTDPKRVLELVMEITKSAAGVTRDPAPVVLFSGFGASSLDFIIRAWTDHADWGKVRSDLVVQLHDAIAAAGIEIPFPQQDLHLRSISPDINAALSRLADANSRQGGTQP